MPVDRHVRYRLFPGQDSVAERPFVGDPLVHLLAGEHRGRAEPDDAGNVLCTAPEAVLLASPVDYGFGRYAAAYVQGADALRPVELVSRERQRRNRRVGDVDRNPASGLDGVGMERDLPLGAEARELAYWLDSTDLVVRPDDGGQRRVGAQHCGELVGVDQPVGVDLDPGHLESFLLQALRVLANRRVLHAGDN